jgi:TetR/AcrR family transcriptional regulator, cholesterol catabolism regulator
MNRASLYYYVADTSELLAEVLRQPAFDMTAVLAEISNSDMTSTEKAREAIAAHMRALASNYPELFVFLAENLYLQTVGDPQGDVVENARQYGNLLTDIIREGQESGEFRTDLDPRIAMLGIVGMCNWTHRWYREGDGMSLPEIGDEFMAMITEGLVIPPRKGRK